MATKKRNANTALEQELLERGYRFNFFKAVTLLEQLYPTKGGVGQFHSPGKEIIKFRAHPSLIFPASQITKLEGPQEADKPFEMTVAFMGLTGPSGVLPQHYTEMLMQEIRDKQEGLRDFLDLFNHRLISLFYRSWEKHHFVVGFRKSQEAKKRIEEEGKRQVQQNSTKPETEKEPVNLTYLDRFSTCLYSIIGLQNDGMQVGRLPMQGESLIYYAGLLGQKRRSAICLRQFLEQFFDVQIRVKQFVGEWLTISADEVTRLGRGNRKQLLGQTTQLGSKVWDQQARIEIRVGPMSFQKFFELLPLKAPGVVGKFFERLSSLTSFFTGPNVDFSVRLILQAEEIQACKLHETESFVPRLGWTTWLSSQSAMQDNEDVVFSGSV